MKTIFPDEIPEEMEDLREGTDSIEDSLKPILDTDEKLPESTSSALGKLTASSSMLSAIPKYSFTNPILQKLKENYTLNMAGMLKTIYKYGVAFSGKQVGVAIG